MALPAHLQRYDELLDLLVDELVRRELVREAGAELSEAAAGEKPAAADHTEGGRHGTDGHADCKARYP